MSHQICSTKDSWVTTAQGRLRARCWEPPDHGHDPVRRAPIVLFHDSLGCIELWRTFPAILATLTNRSVVAYDRLGFGQSDRRTDALNVHFVREEAERFFPALCEQLGIKRFIAFGHSVGGGMAAWSAALHAPICDGLITESAQTFVEDRTRSGIIGAQDLFRQPKQFERLRRYHGEKARWVLGAWIDTWLSSEFSNWSLACVLPQIQCPTLIIHGSEDEYGSNAHPEMIERCVTGPAEIEILPGARHVPHREQEEWVVKRVARFIGSNVPRDTAVP